MLRLLTLIDEYTREGLAIRVARSINAREVVETLADVMLQRGVPQHIRSDNGPGFTAKVIREWLKSVGSQTLYIEPGSPRGERRLRIVQWQDPERMPQPGDLLQPQGSEDRD